LKCPKLHIAVIPKATTSALPTKAVFYYAFDFKDKIHYSRCRVPFWSSFLHQGLSSGSVYACQTLLQSTVSGFDSAIFSYGHPGSGTTQTYTIEGKFFIYLQINVKINYFLFPIRWAHWIWIRRIDSKQRVVFLLNFNHLNQKDGNLN
jgi:hypothetical protein